LRGAVSRRESLTAKVYDAWTKGEFTLLTSEDIVSEIQAVLHRPVVQQKLGVATFEVEAIVQQLRRKALFITVTIHVRICRDPNDDKFLECAVDGKADYIVSADEDLLTMRVFQHIPIIDIPTFWRVLSLRRKN